MLRFSGKCGESTASSWSDWHGNATKKAVAATAKNGNNFEILITEFSCTLPAHSGFFQLVSWHGVVFWRLQWPGFQGRGSRAHHKNIFLFKPFTMDVWSDGAVRKLKFLFSRPSRNKPQNNVYPEDMPSIVQTFGHDALAGLEISQNRTKAQDVAAADAAGRQIPIPVVIRDLNQGMSVGRPFREHHRYGEHLEHPYGPV